MHHVRLSVLEPNVLHIQKPRYDVKDEVLHCQQKSYNTDIVL